MKKSIFISVFFLIAAVSFSFIPVVHGVSDAYKHNIYDPGRQKPTDSKLKVKVGMEAPDFTLKAVAGGTVSLKQYRGKKNVVLSFVPAAWTPVCSDQWPGYNIVKDIFEENDAVLLGISVDNIPTLHSWINQMGDLWFPVLSDFWPHGKAATLFGILRSDGTAERAIIVIDKKGIIRYIDVHNVNERPPLEGIIRELEKLR
ncbi:MAG: redoxin domain-containing protein [Deltaproteobacteria bacterium]|nr:redoxin domain-containing protein [Deltaproteobacteria bacterium]